MAKPRGELSLQEAATRLGVHYMTAYRYVRTGQLSGRREHGEWRLRAADVDAFARRPRQGSSGRGTPRWDRHVSRLVDRLVQGDEPGSWQIVERALVGGADPTDVYVRIVGPSLRRIGDAWASGRMSVADEHRAAAVATRIVSRMGPRFTHPGRRRGTVIVGAVANDHHALPAAMVADVLRGERYAVVDLGAATPVESFVSAAEEADALVAVGLSACTTEALDEAEQVIVALRADVPGTPVLLGGPAVADQRTALAAGADAWAPDAAATAAVLEGIISRRS